MQYDRGIPMSDGQTYCTELWHIEDVVSMVFKRREGFQTGAPSRIDRAASVKL